MSSFLKTGLVNFCTVSLFVVLITFADSCKDFREPFSIPEKSFEIKQLVLSGRNPDQNFHFWTNELGLNFTLNANGSFGLQIGTSRLVFNPAPPFGLPPQYHFAINIPSNQIENALDWLLNENGKYPDGPKKPVKIWTASESGAQITRRDLFNAHSVYFSDPAGNVIELVARHQLNNAQAGAFNKSMFLNISEVSVITKDIRKANELLESNFGVSEIPGSSSSYKPVGGSTGFLDLIVPGRPLGPNPDVQAFPFGMEITIKHTAVLEDLLIPQSNVVIKTEL